MRRAMAVMEMQAPEPSVSQGHQHLLLEDGPERGKELRLNLELSEETSLGW